MKCCLVESELIILRLLANCFFMHILNIPRTLCVRFFCYVTLYFRIE